MISLDTFYGIAIALADAKPIPEVYEGSPYHQVRTQWEQDCIAVAEAVTDELLERGGVKLDVEKQRFLDICGLNQSLPRETSKHG